MAEAVVSLALETLRDLLLEEARFLSGVSREVRALEKQLKEIKCLLEDADQRKHESKIISNWIAEVRDLAYRSEDVIETYAVQVSSKRGPGLKKLFGRFSSILNECFSTHQIGSEISEIKSEIARLNETMKEFGIRSIIQGESSNANKNDSQRWRRQTYPVESEDCFVGKDDDLKQLVSLIVDDKQHRVISIWGMGGIGKTTIARKVYNHSNTKRHFECFAWVCITQECHSRSVLEDVLKQLIPQRRGDISSLTDTELIQEFCQIQRTKRCIIVLDDLWQTEHWDGLKPAFLVQGSNSKVLVTTRKQKVAGVGFAYELGLLKINDGWELLKKKAFPYNNIPENFGMEEKRLEKIGKEMVHKCGYLPLVISILGGLLSKRESFEEWKSLNESINAHLYTEDNEINGILNLSYEDLPYYLKPCFLLMGQFREDETIHCRHMYRIWISHGMISHDHRGKDKTLMDVAEAYLTELVSRCLVHIPHSDVKYMGKYYYCQLHDSVRELCLLEGKNEGFNFRVINYRCGEFNSVLNESLLGIATRHLAIHFERPPTTNLNVLTINHEDTRKHVRSLQFLNKEDNEVIEFQHDTSELEKFKLLRILVFKKFRLKGRQLKGIGSLIHLRFLVLTSCELEELPSSIRNLKYLHTLDLYYCWNVRVPNVLKEMHRLKYLILPFYEEAWVAQNNYHLSLEGLGELETLDKFNSMVNDWKSVMTMKNLKTIAVNVYDNKSLSAVINAIITNWTNLKRVDIVINPDCHLESTEEGLAILKNMFSCQTLIMLIIRVPIERLQLEECITEISTSRLISLILFGCEIEDDPMRILETFPFLEELKLIVRAFVGEELKCHASGFPCLKRIELKTLPNLREWTVEQGAMPLLASIKIEKCPRLEMIPDGLRFTRNLQELKILDMPELGKRVDAEVGEDFDKVCDVPSIIVG